MHLSQELEEVYALPNYCGPENGNGEFLKNRLEASSLQLNGQLYSLLFYQRCYNRILTPYWLGIFRLNSIRTKRGQQRGPPTSNHPISFYRHGKNLTSHSTKGAAKPISEMLQAPNYFFLLAEQLLLLSKEMYTTV